MDVFWFFPTSAQRFAHEFPDFVDNKKKIPLVRVVLCEMYIEYRNTIDSFSVSKHSDVFLWAELSWRLKDSSDRFTNASYEVC